MIEEWVWDASGPTVIVSLSNGTKYSYRVDINTWLLMKSLRDVADVIELQTEKYEEVMSKVTAQGATQKGATRGRAAKS